MRESSGEKRKRESWVAGREQRETGSEREWKELDPKKKRKERLAVTNREEQRCKYRGEKNKINILLSL